MSQFIVAFVFDCIIIIQVFLLANLDRENFSLRETVQNADFNVRNKSEEELIRYLSIFFQFSRILQATVRYQSSRPQSTHAFEHAVKKNAW